jgi:hypothetical protein
MKTYHSEAVASSCLDGFRAAMSPESVSSLREVGSVDPRPVCTPGQEPDGGQKRALMDAPRERPACSG